VEALLGRGGMGVVYRARHLALKRTVALKMLAAGHSHPAERVRFRAEAEAVARLQHPNIVQIHEVGEAAGRPFFALEFVEGGSLARRLAGQVLPPRDAARLVGALAEAMHLAHSRNLVHRDLKPANVLLVGRADTPVGQCQPKVSDFGLARQLDSDSDQTQVGQVMGTPSYMAPEQAEGRAHAAGPAADVYALGAILYECLTGRPPFQGATALETLEQVRTREPAAPSALNRQAPRDLETVCLKCLRKKPERRYSSARELADDLGRFVRGEPVTARPVGVAESVWKWVCRRPALAGLLAVVVLLAGAAGVGTWLLHQQRAQTDRLVRGILARARSLLKEGWQAHDLAKVTEAEAEGGRAVDIAQGGGVSPAVRQEAEAVWEDAALRLGRAKKNRALLEALLDVSGPQETRVYTRDETGRLTAMAQPGEDEQYAAAFRRWGLDVKTTADAEVARRLRQEPDAVVQELIAGLDAWMMERRSAGRPEAEWRHLFRVAERLDRSERHRRLRALLIGSPPPRAAAVAGLVGAGSPWPAVWELARGNAWRRLRGLRGEIDPRTEPVLTVVLLARAFAAVGDAAGAEEVLRQAAAARPNQVVLLDALGKLLERQGAPRLEEAIGYFRAARGQRGHLGLALGKALLRAGRPVEAEEVLRELAAAQQKNPAFHVALGTAAFGRQKYRDAEAAYRKALELEPDLAAAYSNLGNALGAQRKYREAEAACRKATVLEPDLAEAQFNLGIALMCRQKTAEAEAAYRRAVRLRPDFAEAHTNLGNALVWQGRCAEAESAYRRAIALRPDLAHALYHLGNSLMAQRSHAEAESAFRRTIDLEPGYAEAHANLGTAQLRQGKPAEAEAACRKAICLKPDLAEAHSNLGIALMSLGRLGEAEAACRRAIALKPDFADSHYHLGNTLMGQGRCREAETAYRRAADLRPDLAEAHSNLGHALIPQGRFAEAESACRRAVSLKPDLPEASFNLGLALLAQGKYREAEAAYRKAIALRPDLAEAHYHLGLALWRQARFHHAAASLKKAGELLPAKDSRRERARRLGRQCQRYVTLDARLPAILEGTEKPANAAEQLEFARLCFLRKDYAAAARFSRAAFAAEPKLAEAVAEATRYDAACAAALAGCGQGKDGTKLDERERADWRRQAIDWLRQDLAWWGKALDRGDEQTRARVRLAMRHWQADDDFAGVRGKEALARLPAQERKEWERLWADVDALLRRASEPR
jgi:serine/threonine-protein kinase